MSSILKNVGSQNVTFCLVLASNGAAGVGLAPTSANCWTCKDGTQAAIAGTITTAGNGQYVYAPTTAETNCTDFGLFVAVTGAVPTNLDFHTDVVDANGYLGINLVDIAGSALSVSTAQIGVNLVNIAGSATQGAAGYVGVDWNKVDNPTSTVALTNTTISPTQTVATVTGNVNGSVGSVAGNVVGSVGSVVGNVGGNVIGSVASVVAQVTANVTDINAISVATVTAVGAYLGTSVAPSLTAAGLHNISSNVKQNTATNGFMFIMTYASSHAPATGLTVTSQVSLNGGAFASTVNTASEVSNGWYTINLAAADLNGAHVALRFTNAAADDTDIEINTQP